MPHLSTHRVSLIAALFLFLLLPACQSLKPGSDSRAYIGSFVFKYAGGNTYRVDVPDDTSIRWECLAGDEKGKSEQERVDRRAIAHNIYFVSWTEKDGTIVSQVIDLNRHHVTSTISLGRNRYFLEGSVTRIPSK